MAASSPKKNPAKAASPRANRAGRAPTTAVAATKKPTPRADFGTPVDGFFAKKSPQLRAIVEQLRSLVIGAVPDASSPWYQGVACACSCSSWWLSPLGRRPPVLASTCRRG